MKVDSKKLPKLDIPNSSGAISRLRYRQRRLVDGLIELGMEYSNKIVGSIFSAKANQYFLLRECIYYRMSAMLLHLELLLAVQKNHENSFAKSPFDERAKMTLLDVGTQNQMALLDSIIFHAISLFDYLGNLIDYFCGDKGQMSLKWNGVLNSVRDSKNPLSKSPIAPVVLKLHDSFVNRLYEHRSHLIHLRADMAGAQTTIKLMTAETEFTVFSPKRLTQLFPQLSSKSVYRRLTIKYVAFWVCAKSLIAAWQILRPLFQHLELNRKTPNGFAIFISQPSK